MTSDTEKLNEEIIRFLRQDEMNYPDAAKRFGAPALPLLKELINSNDENLATKAAYLAGYISHGSVNTVLEEAATNKFSTVRIAAAFGAKQLGAKNAKSIISKVLQDNDPGVLKTALNSIEHLNIAKDFQAQLKNISKAGHVQSVKNSAAALVKKIK